MRRVQENNDKGAGRWADRSTRRPDFSSKARSSRPNYTDKAVTPGQKWVPLAARTASWASRIGSGDEGDRASAAAELGTRAALSAARRGHRRLGAARAAVSDRVAARAAANGRVAARAAARTGEAPGKSAVESADRAFRRRQYAAGAASSFYARAASGDSESLSSEAKGRAKEAAAKGGAKRARMAGKKASMLARRARNAAAGAMKKAAAGKALRGIAAKAGSKVAIILLPLLLVCILAVVLVVSFMGISENTAGTGSLEGNEKAVAAFLLSKGLDKTHVAAIMGNFSVESGMNPRIVQGGALFDSMPESCMDEGNATGYGLAQWTYYTRTRALHDFAQSKGTVDGNLQTQLEFFMTEFSDSMDEFKGVSGLGEATRWFHEAYERSADDERGLQKRVREAGRIFAALNSSSSGKGQEYAASTEEQKAIVDACYDTPFCGDGLCASWVTAVYAASGMPVPTGNANDMWAQFCTLHDRGYLKVGMMVAVQHSGASGDSWDYGHIGIYVGDGLVMHNESSATGNASNGCTLTDIDEWIAEYDYSGTVGWGYPA